MDSSTSLKPFFTYFGGKFRAAGRYPEPAGGLVVEPFAGAAGYSVRNFSPSLKVVLNDLDEKVAGTWDYLIRSSSDEIMRLPVYDGTWETVDDIHGMCQEQRWLIGWHLNKGSASPSKRPSKWMRQSLADGESIGANYWGEEIKARLARQVELIKHWEIHHGDYQNLPDYKDATWFVDPPYQVAGRGYRTNKVDYNNLAEWCQNRDGLTIVCENSGADWLQFEPLGDIKGTAGRYRSGVSEEVIWVNRNHLHEDA